MYRKAQSLARDRDNSSLSELSLPNLDLDVEKQTGPPPGLAVDPDLPPVDRGFAAWSTASNWPFFCRQVLTSLVARSILLNGPLRLLPAKLFWRSPCGFPGGR